MMPAQEIITIESHGPGLREFTNEASAFVRTHSDELGIRMGLLTLFVRHTSASLIIQENADPDVQRDLHAWLERLIPDADDPAMAYLVHRAEGPDDMPAHIKSVLTQTHLSIPVSDGQLMLGTWQGIYLWEHRSRPHRREVVLHLA